MTEEHGQKITKAVTGMPSWQRQRTAKQLIDSVIAVPLLTHGTNVTGTSKTMGWVFLVNSTAPAQQQ